MSESRLSDKDFQALLKQHYEHFYNEYKSHHLNDGISFVPFLIANNLFDGGLGPSKFDKIVSCGLSKNQLVGREAVKEQDFINFYSNVAKEVTRIKYGKERIERAMQIAHEFAKKDEFLTRVEKIVKLFERLDKDKSETLDKNEVLDFYNEMNKNPMEKDQETKESEKTLKWVDRNGDGKVTLLEFVSCSFSKSMLEKTKDEWYSYLKSLHLDLDSI